MLKSLFSSTPKWQSSNADERLTAVAELAADDPALHTLATTDADTRVRIAAIGRTITVKTLSATVADADAAVSAAAAARWGVLAAGDAPTADLPLAVVAAAVREDSSAEWKAAAARCATRDLGAWLESHAIVSVKLEAIASSIDVALLEKLHLHWRDHDKRIGKACHDRVVDLQSRDKAAQEADVLMAQMQSWAEADEVPLTKLVDTQRAWAKLTVDADHKARFEALLVSLQRKMQNEAASRRLHEALAMQVAGLSLKSKKASELNTEELNALAHDATVAQSSPVLDAGLAQQLQQVHSTIAGEQQSRERNAAGEALLASIPQPPKRLERERAPKKPREPKPAAEAAPLTQIETRATGDATATAAPNVAPEIAPAETSVAPVEPVAA
ncbi:MAG TPA: hypothetical protein PLK42_11530, partial [Casimicrobium sp.]|nr:hypothetical protein [Casimicrobium sp.]